MQEAGLEASTVTVGACHVELRAPAPVGRERGDEAESDDRNRMQIYRDTAGDMFESMIAERVPGVDLQPAIGRTR